MLKTISFLSSESMATNGNDIQLELRRNLAEVVEIHEIGPDRYGIVTPMAFDDGDLLPLVLRKDEQGWWPAPRKLRRNEVESVA